MEILGVILLIIGGIISSVCHIWILVIAFHQSVLWGFGSLLVPFVTFIFVVMYWAEAKKPFLIFIAGGVLLLIGGLLVAIGGA
ncbi:MAG: hypothetical protein JSV89_17490 [Spirochaetaceae bacterium]|nr:MAG: hypothetical protein JSV89_17490 [Spirochaetaceae bacterium]